MTVLRKPRNPRKASVRRVGKIEEEKLYLSELQFFTKRCQSLENLNVFSVNFCWRALLILYVKMNKTLNLENIILTMILKTLISPGEHLNQSSPVS